MEVQIDKIRFHVVDDADRRRSSTWYAQSAGDNVYVGVQATGGQSKLSFHPPGQSRDGCDSQYGFTRHYAEREAALGTPEVRKPVRWIRPSTPAIGVALVVSIAFPTEFLRAPALAPPTKKRRFALPAAPVGHALVVGVFYSQEHPDVLEERFIGRGVTPLFYMTLPCGEFVSITAEHLPFDPTIVPDFTAAGPLVRPLSGAPTPGQTVANAHAVLSSHPAHGAPIRLAEVNGLSVLNTSLQPGHD